MQASRVTLFVASVRWPVWWPRVAWRTDGAVCAEEGATAAPSPLQLPDAVVDACLPRRATSCSVHDDRVCWHLHHHQPALLLRIPRAPRGSCGGCGAAERSRRVAGVGHASEAMDASAEVVPVSTCETVGEMHEALREVWRCVGTPPPSLESLFVRLSSLAPLFVRLHATGGTVLEVLGEYCTAVVAAAAAAAGTCPSSRTPEHHPLLRRLVREVRVSWQPWLSDAQVARVAAGGCTAAQVTPGSLPACPLAATPPWTGAVGDRHPRQRAPSTRDAVEESWLLLLEHVPPFFVATAAVEASVQRACPQERASCLVHAWVSRRPSSDSATPEVTVGAARALSSSGRGCGARHESCMAGERLRGPYVEASLCGRAVRCPSREQCIQAGCPPHLLYRAPSSVVAVRHRYTLLRCIDGADDARLLLHEALALLCAVVPSTPVPLALVRRRFNEQHPPWQRQQRLVGCGGPSAAERSAAQSERSSPPTARHRVCASFFSCVEVLLDHPELAFAVRIVNGETGQACAQLPLLGEAATAVEVHVQLHPAFSHAQRGNADAALSAMNTARRAAAITGAARTPPRHAARVCAVRLHDARDGGVPASVEELLRSRARHLSAARQNGLVGVSEVGSGEEDASATPAVVLLTVVHDDHRGVDVVAVDAGALAAQVRRRGGAVDAPADPATGVARDSAACGAAPLLRLLADVLCARTAVWVLPADAFHHPGDSHQRRPSQLDTLLNALPAEAAARDVSVCRLAHVAHYVGYPLGSTVSTAVERVEEETRMACLICARHGTAVDASASSRDGGAAAALLSDAAVLRAVSNAATTAVAASLLLHSSSSSSSSGPAPGESLSRALRRWSAAPAMARRHALAVRVTRFEAWLADVLAEVSETAGTSRTADVGVAATLSVEALERRLRDLVSRFGPEPMPDLATTAAQVEELGVAALAAESAVSPVAPNSAECVVSETCPDVDALLLDALVEDAAAVRRAAEGRATPMDDTGSPAAAAAVSGLCRDDAAHPATCAPAKALGPESPVSEASSPLPPAPSSTAEPVGAHGARSANGAAEKEEEEEEEDGLQRCLALLFDETDGNAATPLPSQARRTADSPPPTPPPSQEDRETGASTAAPLFTAAPVSGGSATFVPGVGDVASVSSSSAPGDSAPTRSGGGGGGGGSSEATAADEGSTTAALPRGFFYGPRTLATDRAASSSAPPLQTTSSPPLPSAAVSPAATAPVARPLFDRFAPYQAAATSVSRRGCPVPDQRPLTQNPNARPKMQSTLTLSPPCPSPPGAMHQPRRGDTAAAHPPPPSRERGSFVDALDADRAQLAALVVDILYRTARRTPPSPGA